MSFDQILVNSSFSRESVLRAFGVDSKVCYLGVDTERFTCQNKKRENFTVCVAALLPTKNIEFLIRSLATICAARRPKLVLISNMIDESYLDQVQDLAGKTGVDFELKHRIADAELIDLLNRARMMLYAPRLEPFGYAPVEANACGLPVVAVAEGGVRETIQDGINGLLVEHEPQCMAQA
ncbi:MAG TPA: glycosyltransferase family 4 protein, partial [Candidatus Deferrimicrobiaceae bacterium]|nr:glycosyltransferase family 4 protein [Candidatus Deferrimicrobiaceae bacterium]